MENLIAITFWNRNIIKPEIKWIWPISQSRCSEA